MNTRDLTAMLAAGVSPVSRAVPEKRISLAVGAGAFGALLIMLTWMGLRPDFITATATAMFWIKLGFPLALGVIALFTLLRLSRPGMHAGQTARWLVLPVVAIWIVAADALISAQPAQRSALLLGQTWLICPVAITGLSIPAFVAALWALADLAPTRMTATGAAAGLLSGAVGALVYALHCPETGAPFLGLWYLLGIVLPALAGAALGPRLLRW